MSLEKVIKSMKVGIVVTPGNLEQGVKDALEMLQRDGIAGTVAMTAIGMVLNATAKELEELIGIETPEDIEVTVETEKSEPITEKAMSLYTPPFDYHCGYISSAKEGMFADLGGAVEQIARIRGWGRIQYMKDFTPEDLQDEVGRLFAQALTEFWENNSE